MVLLMCDASPGTVSLAKGVPALQNPEAEPGEQAGDRNPSEAQRAKPDLGSRDPGLRETEAGRQQFFRAKELDRDGPLAERRRRWTGGFATG